MSFNITARGTVAEVREQIANLTDDDAPKSIRKMLAHELTELEASAVPDDAEISLTAYGHLGWSTDQTAGQSSVNIVIAAPADEAAEEAAAEDADAAEDEAGDADATDDAAAGADDEQAE